MLEADAHDAQMPLAEHGDHATAIADLIGQRLGEFLDRALDQNRVIGALAGAAIDQRAGDDGDVEDVLRGKARLGLGGQFGIVLDGDDGLLAGAGDLLLLIGSTSSPTGVRAIAERLHRQSGGRVRVVDCPVSGGVDGASAGTLSIMLGGTDADAALAAQILSPCGTPVHLGPLGAGEVAKACNQLVVAATIVALGEATELAARSGLDLDALWSLLAGGYAGSNLLASRKDRLVAGDDSPSGAAAYMVKDLGFAADVAASTHTATALLPALRALFDELVDAGLGDRDISVTRRLTARRLGAPTAAGADYAET